MVDIPIPDGPVLQNGYHRGDRFDFVRKPFMENWLQESRLLADTQETAILTGSGPADMTGGSPGGGRIPHGRFLLGSGIRWSTLDAMEADSFNTAYAQSYPTVTQLSIFFENQVGQLLRLTRLFDQTDIHILALSVVNSIDCAIIRMIVDDPDTAHELLAEGGFAVNPTEILVVSLPEGKRALLHTWVALLSAEVSVLYTYPLLAQVRGLPALAVQADQLEHAAEALSLKGFGVLDQADLQTRD